MAYKNDNTILCVGVIRRFFMRAMSQADALVCQFGDRHKKPFEKNRTAAHGSKHIKRYEDIDKATGFDIMKTINEKEVI